MQVRYFQITKRLCITSLPFQIYLQVSRNSYLDRENVQFVSSKVVADINGRYVIVQGRLYNFPVVLVNIYAPNWDSHDFYKHLFSCIPESGTHYLILGGDFNTVLQPSLDRSKSAHIIKMFCLSSGVVDLWRFKNPTLGEFSFFSTAHQTYSRIDFFLVDKKILPPVKLCRYDSIVISDHSPVIMELWFQNNVATRRPDMFRSQGNTPL